MDETIDEKVIEKKVVRAVVPRPVPAIVKKSPEQWAREYKIDTDLVLWWTNQNREIDKKEFEKILKILKIEE